MDKSQPSVRCANGNATYITAGRWSPIPDDMESFIDVEIGNFTSIAGGCKIVSGQHPPVDHPGVLATFPFSDWSEWSGLGYPGSRMGGKVVIGSDVWIGQDVHILEGVTIGDGAIVGACSVVTKPVVPYAVVVGNPAVLKKYRFGPDRRSDLLRWEWWNLSDEYIRSQIDRIAGNVEL